MARFIGRIAQRRHGWDTMSEKILTCLRRMEIGIPRECNRIFATLYFNPVLLDSFFEDFLNFRYFFFFNE